MLALTLLGGLDLAEQEHGKEPGFSRSLVDVALKDVTGQGQLDAKGVATPPCC
jgi:hypothetical protein